MITLNDVKEAALMLKNYIQFKRGDESLHRRLAQSLQLYADRGEYNVDEMPIQEAIDCLERAGYEIAVLSGELTEHGKKLLERK